MSRLGKFAFGSTLALGILLGDIAAAAPLGISPAAATGTPLVELAGGVVCDLNGCRTYENRRRRVYVDPPYYDDDSGFFDDPGPPVYVRPRPPIYVDPPVYRERRPVMSRRHVEWCLDRYRSYNPRTNLYMARRNVFRQCLSPWS